MSIIQDETVCASLRQLIRGLKINDRTPENFHKALNEGLLREVSQLSPNEVSLDTARRWMHFLGFSAERHKKGYYVDGHERQDVVQHRQRYLDQMALIEPRTLKYDGNKMENTIYPDLQDGQRRAVCIFHDESCYNSNDSNSIIFG